MSDQPAAGWYVDPTHRFEHRYWDGTTWTEHVSRNGQATTDPLDGSGAASSAVTGTTASADVGRSAIGATTTTPWDAQTTRSTRTNTKAIVALVLSIIWVGGLASVAAIVLGVIARREIRDRPDETGSGVATASIVIGIVGVVGAAFLFLAALAVMFG